MSATTINRPLYCGQLWLLPLRAASEAELFLRAQLRPTELAYFEALRGTQRRMEWLAGRTLVREQLGGRISYLPSGAPILKEPHPAFSEAHISISHTTGWAALMVSLDGPCGIDIEPLARDAARVAGRIALPEEIALAAAHFPENPELLVWCAKEATYKAAGVAGVDFRDGIRIREAAARSLTVELAMCRVRIEYFIVKDLLITCGTIS